MSSNGAHPGRWHDRLETCPQRQQRETGRSKIRALPLACQIVILHCGITATRTAGIAIFPFLRVALQSTNTRPSRRFPVRPFYFLAILICLASPLSAQTRPPSNSSSDPGCRARSGRAPAPRGCRAAPSRRPSRASRSIGNCPIWCRRRRLRRAGTAAPGRVWRPGEILQPQRARRRHPGGPGRWHSAMPRRWRG